MSVPAGTCSMKMSTTNVCTTQPSSLAYVTTASNFKGRPGSSTVAGGNRNQ